MKIQDCKLNPDRIAMAPFVRSEPEEPWIQARDKGLIPASLFDLYKRASYLSFGSAPLFLKDTDGILFSYFSLILRSLMLSLVDSAEYLNDFVQVTREAYYPGKYLDDPTWTREKSEATAKRSYDLFKSQLMCLMSALDTTAELIAIFSQGKINNVRVGNAAFSQIEVWLGERKPKLRVIATPQQIYLAELHDRLRPLVESTPPEKEWLPYMRLLRNKAIHLGPGLFRSSVLSGDDGKFYMFIPREWPYLWEKYMKPPGEQSATMMPELLLKTLIHQDIAEYAQGAQSKVYKLIDEALALTAKAYSDFSDFSFNQVAVSELMANSKHFAFENFL